MEARPRENNHSLLARLKGHIICGWHTPKLLSFTLSHSKISLFHSSHQTIRWESHDVCQENIKAFVEKRLFNYSYRLPWWTGLQVANSLSLRWFRVRRAKWLFDNWIIRQGNTLMYRFLNACWVKIKPFKDWHLIRIVNKRYATYFKNPAT